VTSETNEVVFHERAVTEVLGKFKFKWIRVFIKGFD
jgi:hypothetical protein